MSIPTDFKHASSTGRARLVSIIIPTLNESEVIERTLVRVKEQPEPLEIIVADGGSSDDTRRLVAAHARVITAPRGRARQMNAGADVASGDIFVFLHADTRLPAGALAHIRQVLADPYAVGGCFRLSFDASSWPLRLYSFATRLPWHRIAFGDRAYFVRRDVFDRCPFPDLPVFEDLEFFKHLRRQGRVVYSDQAVVTAARRFTSNGPIRQQLRNFCLWTLYTFGVSPHRLARFYPYPAAGRVSAPSPPQHAGP